MSKDSPQFPIPGILENYLVFAKLNKGGMANVYLGQRMDRAGWVAIKVLREKLTSQPRFVEMFNAEGELGTILHHQNIARTQELTSTFRNGKPVHFLSMEYVHGRDMGAVARNLRRANARMSPQQGLYLAAGVLEALTYAHDLRDELGTPLNVVNKDVSPPNIMASFQGEIKLIDFGIAQATLDYRSQIGAIKGKLRYMSPEQVRGHAVDARSDLFSLAVVLYELVTGTEPFTGETDFEQMEKVRNAEVVPPIDLNPRLGAKFDKLLRTGLAKSAEDRFQSAEEMLSAVLGAQEEMEPYRAENMAAFMRASFRKDMETLRANVLAAQKSLKSALAGGALELPTGPDLGVDTSEVDRTLDATDVDALSPGPETGDINPLDNTVDAPHTRQPDESIGHLETRPSSEERVRVRVDRNGGANSRADRAETATPPPLQTRPIAPLEPLASDQWRVVQPKGAPGWAKAVLALLSLAILVLTAVLIAKML